MYPLVIVLFGTMILMSVLNMNQTKQAAITASVVADVAAANFWSYRQAVSQYYSANPTVTGTIADSVLTFPMGYIRNSNWSNMVADGVLYTFSTTALVSGTVTAIATRGGATMTIGIASGTTMSSLTNSASGFTLPAGINNGSIVVIGN